ncbi:MAG: His/Gly/Thr/Pro-type tRNA ligase C-terminal domain-containing protein, partial [Dehalococcoidia bacterium]
LYTKLSDSGKNVLLDDRDESPGVKFNDADLLGMPVRATVSPRNLKEGAIEVKLRTDAESQLVPVDESPERISGMLSAG